MVNCQCACRVQHHEHSNNYCRSNKYSCCLARLLSCAAISLVQRRGSGRPARGGRAASSSSPSSSSSSCAAAPCQALFFSLASSHCPRPHHTLSLSNGFRLPPPAILPQAYFLTHAPVHTSKRAESSFNAAQSRRHGASPPEPPPPPPPAPPPAPPPKTLGAMRSPRMK